MPKSPPRDSDAYLAKKQFFQQLLTVYGRKPVLEALQAPSVNLHRLHLAEGNRPAPLLDEIIALAQARGAELVYHSRQALARISKNGRQDQGVAADIDWRGYQSCQRFLQRLDDNPDRPLRLLALCDIHNPQNLGMIIRSACAGDIDGVIIPKKGCATISSPLVIKASAGTLFKAPIISCEKLKDALQAFKDHRFSVCALSSHATESLFDHRPEGPVVYVLGNESEGVNDAICSLADKKLIIPMSNKVESLNVAITAALIAFTRGL